MPRKRHASHQCMYDRRTENVEEFIRVREEVLPSQYKRSKEMEIPQIYELKC